MTLHRPREPLPARVEHRLALQLEVARRVKAQTKAAARPAPFLTISRQFGCGAVELAEQLGSALAAEEGMPDHPWPVYSRKIIEDIAAETGLPAQLLDALDVHARSGLEEFFATLVGKSPPDIRILRHLVHAVRALALVGRCIIVGRGGALLTEGLPGGMHIRLTAPEAWRLKNLVSRFGWEETKARTLLREEEEKPHGFFQKYLGHDAANPNHYDAILNVAKLSRSEQIAMVVALFKTRFPKLP